MPLISRQMAAWGLHARFHEPVRPPWFHHRVRAHIVQNFPTRGILCGILPGLMLVVSICGGLAWLVTRSPYLFLAFMFFVCMSCMLRVIGRPQQILLSCMVALFRADAYHAAVQEVQKSMSFHEKMDEAAYARAFMDKIAGSF